MIGVDRARVLGYRFDVHDLDPSTPGTGEAVLASGVQDYPPGRSAALALRLRTGKAPADGTVLVHSVRGAMHLHHAAELAGLAAALRYEDAQDMPPQAIGPFGAELTEAGIAFGDALDEVAAAMRTAVADGENPTKGELSGAVSPEVNPRLAPWCEGCGVHHIHDKLFRMATLQAGLVIDLDADSPSMFRFRPVEKPEAETTRSRAELVRAFLVTFGPAKPAQLASWLSLTPAAARKWWDVVADEFRPVTVDGGKCWTHAEHVDALRSAPNPRGIRLLPPYDPLTELADRTLLAPDPAQRKAVWRAAANPGIVLLDGEIAGVWRQRRARDRLTLRVEPFTKLSARRRKEAETDAATIAAYFGARDADLTFD